MADGFIPIPRIVVGEESLVSASRANEIIDLLNAIGGGRVAPIANVGKMMLAGGQFIIDLSLFDARLRKVEAAVYGPAGNNTTSLANTVAMINNSLHAASINATCDENTRMINVVLTFPNLP